MAPKLRVLLILGEHPNWRGARHISYHCHLGLEESLKNHGVEVTTLLNPLMSQAPTLLKGCRFDQVWCEVFVNPGLTDEVTEWMAEVAPVRLGLCAESTVYSEEELFVKPELATMSVCFRKRLPYLTHLALGDEADPERWASNHLQTAWWLVSANRSQISTSPIPEPFKARFYGHVYGDRKVWLENPALHGLVDAAPHSEGELFVHSFDFWRLFWRYWNRRGWSDRSSLREFFLEGSRLFRRQASNSWQAHLQSAGAVVSLPLIFKSFPGRVTEGMAAYRPVLCWRVPDRPMLESIFEDGKEIFLYDSPEQLAEQVRRLALEPSLRNQVAQQAQRRLLAYHTTEYRVSQLLRWVESGEELRYSSC